MKKKKLINNTSLFLTKLLRKKNIILYNDLDLLIVIPGDHALKIRDLFAQLKDRHINLLLVIHNLTLKERLLLLRDNIPFIQIDELGKRKVFSKGTKLKFNDEFGKNQNYNRALELLGKLSPKILLTTTDPDLKVLPFIKIAKKMNIKTITIQHGAYESAKGANYRSSMAFVWGDYYKKWFIEKLKKEDRNLEITGSPFFDQFKIEKLKDDRFSINKLRVLLLLTKYPSYESYLNIEITKLIDYLSKIGVHEILLRPHPWQTLDKSVLGEIGYTKIKEERGPLRTSLRKSDITVTLNTTAGFDVLIAGKPLIYWNMPKFDTLPFNRSVPSAASAKEVALLCLELARAGQKIKKRKRRELLNDIFYRLDGKSGNRIAKFISQYLDDFSKNEVTVN